MQRTTTADSQPQVKKRSNSLTRMMAAMGLGGDKQENKQVAGYSQPPQGYGFAAVPRARPNTNTVTSQPLRPPPTTSGDASLLRRQAQVIPQTAPQPLVTPQPSATTSRGESRWLASAGFPREVRSLAAKSPTMSRNLARLEAAGWSIEYGSHLSGVFTNEAEKKISLTRFPDHHFANAPDPQKARTDYETSLLAHELNHGIDALAGSRQRFPPVRYLGAANGQTREAYVQEESRRSLLREADAVIAQIKVRDELQQFAGQDIGLPGSQGAHYLRYAQTYAGDENRLREKIADRYGTERPAVPGPATNYADFYRGDAERKWTEHAQLAAYRP